MSTPVVGVTAESTLEEAAKLMMDRGFTMLPVLTTAGRLVGALTEADLGGARYLDDAAAPDDGVLTAATPRLVRQVMRAPALAVPADAELADLAAAMVESHQRCLPVVEGGRVVGVVSWRDLLSRFAQNADRMRRDVQSK